MQSPAVSLTCYPFVVLSYVSSDGPVRHEVPAAGQDASILLFFSAAACLDELGDIMCRCGKLTASLQCPTRL